MVTKQSVQPEYLTIDRLNEIKADLTTLKTKKRKEVAGRLEYAKSLGDLSENAEYQEAREAQALLEDEVSRLEDIVRRAQLITKKDSRSVDLGSCVSVQKKGDKDIREYCIVGPAESNIATGKISHESPIVRALMGKQKGETVTVISPKGSTEYKIISIK
jgi:transcription elongation factor GreA